MTPGMICIQPCMRLLGVVAMETQQGSGTTQTGSDIDTHTFVTQRCPLNITYKDCHQNICFFGRKNN